MVIRNYGTLKLEWSNRRRGGYEWSRKGAAYCEMLLLIMVSFASAFIIGGEIGIVSGGEAILDPSITGATGTGAGAGTGGYPTSDIATKLASYYGIKLPSPAVTGSSPASSALADIDKLLAVKPGGGITDAALGTEIAKTEATLAKLGGGAGDITGPPPAGLTADEAAQWTAAQEKIAELEAAKAAAAKGGTDVVASGNTGTFAKGVGPQSNLGGLFGGTAFGTTSYAGIWMGALMSGAIWGAVLGFGAYALSGMFGLSKQQSKSVGLSVGLGGFAGSTVYLIGTNAAAAAGGAVGGAPIAGITGIFAAHPILWGLGIGIPIGVGVLLATYKKEKKELVRFECLPWEAPLGGENCEKCNEDSLRPCSEYRCKSLGQACEIVNAGSENELCVWVGKDDVKAPQITPWNEILGPGDLRYVPDKTISPPNTGVRISKVGSKGGCLQAFTKLKFGITTDEPAQCRIDYELTDKIDDMNYLFGGDNLFSYNHSEILRVPDPFNEEGDAVPEIHKDGTFTLWTRCRDANGNENVGAFAIRYCVEKGPDASQPVIEGSSIVSGSPVSFGSDRVPIQIFVSEPSTCKWSSQDKSYDDMENTMNCATETYQVTANLDYACSGKLTGIEDRENNDFFFRCKDKAGNTNSESFPLILRGTEQLTIKAVGPNGTIERGTQDVEITLKTETAHGSDEGAATCYFSNDKDNTDSYLPMFGADTHEHNQVLTLEGGSYNYFFRCIDAGGNSAEAETSFSILIDNQEPSITRVFRDGNNLKIITDENAKCSYSLTNCNFNLNEGKAMTYENPSERDTHVIGWDVSLTYHVKCGDFQGNQPRPNACTIIVEGSEF